MDETNKINNELNNVYFNGNFDLTSIINNANISGSSDSYFDN